MSKKIKMDKDELIKEHKNLVKVLKSKDHKDDMKEAKKQEKELKDYEDKDDKKESKKDFGKSGRTKEMLKKSHDMSKDTEHETSRDHNFLDYDSYKRKD